jgi:hypothetical protein
MISNILVIGLLGLNTLILGVGVYGVLRLRSKMNVVRVVCFSEIQSSSGVFKDKCVIRVKAQLMVKDVPYGQPFILSEQVTENLDQDRIDQILKNVMIPLSRVGLKIVSGNVAA